jgi:hypothetical protein
MRTAILGFALALPVAASGQDGHLAGAPISLWRDFTTGSTKAQIKAFKQTQPDRRVEVYPGCMAEMGYRHIKKQLVTIIFLVSDPKLS